MGGNASSLKAHPNNRLLSGTELNFAKYSRSKSQTNRVGLDLRIKSDGEVKEADVGRALKVLQKRHLVLSCKLSANLQCFMYQENCDNVQVTFQSEEITWNKIENFEIANGLPMALFVRNSNPKQFFFLIEHYACDGVSLINLCDEFFSLLFNVRSEADLPPIASWSANMEALAFEGLKKKSKLKILAELKKEGEALLKSPAYHFIDRFLKYDKAKPPAATMTVVKKLQPLSNVLRYCKFVEATLTSFAGAVILKALSRVEGDSMVHDWNSVVLGCAVNMRKLYEPANAVGGEVLQNHAAAIVPFAMQMDVLKRTDLKDVSTMFKKHLEKNIEYGIPLFIARFMIGRINSPAHEEKSGESVSAMLTNWGPIAFSPTTSSEKYTLLDATPYLNMQKSRIFTVLLSSANDILTINCSASTDFYSRESLESIANEIAKNLDVS